MKKNSYLIVLAITAILFFVYLLNLIVLPHGGIEGKHQIVADLIMILITGGIGFYCYNNYKKLNNGSKEPPKNEDILPKQ